MSLQFSIEPKAGSKFNPSDVSRALSDYDIKKIGSDTYTFPASLSDDAGGAAVSIKVSPSSISFSGGNDQLVKNNLKSVVKGLLGQLSYGRVVSGSKKFENEDAAVVVKEIFK